MCIAIEIDDNDDDGDYDDDDDDDNDDDGADDDDDVVAYDNDGILDNNCVDAPTMTTQDKTQFKFTV